MMRISQRLIGFILMLLLSGGGSLLLISCGGSTVAVLAALQYIPAIGGDFCLDSDGDGVDSGCKVNANIQIESSTGIVWEAYYDSRLGLVGETFYAPDDPDLTPNPFNCTVFIGFVDEGEVIAYNNDANLIASTDEIDLDNPPDLCFKGTSVNINLLKLDSGEELLRDDEPNLTEGVWSNIDDDGQLFKFTFDDSGTGDFTGCEIAAGVKTPLAGSYQPSDVDNRIFINFNELRIQRTTGDEVWSGDFVGLSALMLTEPNGSLTRLQRIPDDNNTYNCI